MPTPCPQPWPLITNCGVPFSAGGVNAVIVATRAEAPPAASTATTQLSRVARHRFNDGLTIRLAQGFTGSFVLYGTLISL